MGIWNRLRTTLTGRRMEADLDEELHFHLEMRIQEYVRRGMKPEEARRAALSRFGNLTHTRERTRDRDILGWLEDFGRDLRHGARVLAKAPGFTAVAVLSLALGIGANTAIFSLIDAVMLKTLPVREPERLVLLDWTAKDWPEKILDSHQGNLDDSSGRLVGSSFSWPVVEQLQRAEVFSGAAGSSSLGRLNVYAKGSAAFARGLAVSGNYFHVLGVAPAAGRLITDQDDRPGAAPVAVLSHRYWAARFGEDPAVIGRTIVVNDASYTVAGVAAREFFGIDPDSCPDVYLPLRAAEALLSPPDGQPAFTASQWWWVAVVARLAPGVAPGSAQARADAALQAAMGDARTREVPERVPHLRLLPGAQGMESLRRDFSEPLLILMGVVGLVLAIACTNVASLLLARASARRRETEVRLALGAARGRILRMHLAESLLLSMAGGALGLLISFWATRAMVAIAASANESLALEVRPDLRVLGFTLAVSVLTGLLFGLAPGWRAVRDVSRGGIRPRGQAAGWGGRALVSAQVALSLILLIAAGLFLRSLHHLRTMDVGVEREKLLTFGIDPEANHYPAGRVLALNEQALERIRALPGVRQASFSRHRLFGGGHVSGFRFAGQPREASKGNAVWMHFVGPGYFETLGIPVVAGRSPGPGDREGAPRVGVANQAMVRQRFGGRLPLGIRILVWGDTEVEIVGVVRDVKYGQLKEDAPPTLYLSLPQHPRQLGSGYFQVRFAGSPRPLMAGVRQAMASIDPRLPIFEMQTVAEETDAQLVTERLFGILSGSFALLGLVLAVIGVYGVLSFHVARRTREIGIRMALGALRERIVWMVSRQVLALLAIGVAVGLPAALALGRLVASRLYGLKPHDPATIAGAVAVMALAALAAGILPARTAARVEPSIALRHE